MQLNIKNSKTCRLAKKLSKLTGKNVTQAVTYAIQSKIDEIHTTEKSMRRNLAKKLLKIGKKCASIGNLDTRNPDDILYDAHGLPKDSLQ